MPRLFTALEVPATVADRLTALTGGMPGARWIDRENFHITLRFLGDVDERTAGDAAMALESRTRPPLRISIGDLDVFGGDRPRALIARVEPTEDLLELQAEQERALRRVGLAPEGRKYTPHVTLARLRDVSARAAADWLAARGGAARISYSAERFVLLSSRASVGGGPYVVEQTYPFAAWADEVDGEDDDEALW